MARFRLDLEYVGTRYSGWQIQKNARTVQGALHEAVRAVGKRTDFESYGAGRTDAGVHALQQVAHLDLESRLPPETLRRALNDELPADINLLRIERVDAPVPRAPLRRRARLPLPDRAPAHGLRQALRVVDQGPARRRGARRHRPRLRGHARLRVVQRREARRGGPRRAVKIERVEVAEAGHLLLVRVLGSHFLWKMVRRMVGVMAEAGRGALTPKDAERFLHEPSDLPATLTAPPSGLFLERILYEGDAAPGPLRPVLNL